MGTSSSKKLRKTPLKLISPPLKLLTVERTYPKKKINLNNKCIRCNKLIEEPNFQITRNVRICRKCYNKKMEEQKENMIKYLSNLKFEADEIFDNLYLGNEGSSFLKDDLKKLGITNIIIIGYYLYKFYPNDFDYKIIEVDDDETEDILQYFIPVIIYFLNIKGKCFIHCQAGMSRSASFTIAIVMFIKKINFQNAYDYVFKRREIICPNLGFIEQLKEFDEMLYLINYNIKFLQPMHNILFEGDDF